MKPDPDDLPWTAKQLASELEKLLSSSPTGSAFLRPEANDQKESAAVSEGLATALVFALLIGPNHYRRPLESAHTEPSTWLRKWFEELGGLTAGMRLGVIKDAVNRMLTVFWLGVDTDQLRWWAVLDVLDHGRPQERALAAALCAPLIASALTHGHPESIRALHNQCGDRAGFPRFRNNSQLVHFRIIQWAPYVEEVMNRPPSKSEMETFLRELYPDFPDHPSTWAKAWTKLRIGRAGERKRKGEIRKVTNLALRLRESHNDSGSDSHFWS